MSRRTRFWIKLIAIPVLMISSWAGLILGLRWVNERAYANYPNTLGSAGFIHDWAELTMGLPMVDRSLRANWLTWAHRFRTTAPIDASLERWLADPQGPYPPSMLSYLRDAEAGLVDGRSCLQPGFTLGLRADLPDLLASGKPVTSGGGGDYSALFALATWLEASALVAENPRPFLEDLDRLVSASRYPVRLYDVMIYGQLVGMRDIAWLQAIRDRRVDETRARTWYNDTYDMGEVITIGLTGERFWERSSLASFLALDIRDMDVLDTPGAGTTHRVSNGFVPLFQWRWATLPAGLGHLQFRIAEAEASIFTHPNQVPGCSEIGGVGHLISVIALSNLTERLQEAAATATRSRCLRLAAFLLVQQHTGVPFPTDESELKMRYGQDLLSATATSCGLRYDAGDPKGLCLRSEPSMPPTKLPTPADAVVVIIDSIP